MDERVMQFRVGVMVLATLIITGILLVMFGKLPSFTGHTYPIYVRFNDAPGVTKDTPVRKSGILIGRVGDVQLTDNDTAVMITLQIQGNKKVYENEGCYISKELLVGDTALVFRLPKRRAPGEPIAPGTTLQGKVSDDPTGLKTELQGPIDTVEETGKALTAASKQLGAAAKRVEDILNEDAQRDVRNILKDAAQSLKTIQKMLGDEENQAKLAEAIKKLPGTLDSMNRTFQATDETLRTFTERSKADGRTPIQRMVETIEMTERTLRKFSESTDPDKPPPADQIAKAMENISEITTLMRSVMTRIDRGEGSLGALLNDRQLYDRFNRAAKNIEQISQQLKPIVADARVISDKVARHPGSILRDAVKPGVGIK
jgi:phospholipid/cholesterol/gamma-HCH transport system substrate-binding protein